jgi:hypothetical protein
MSASGGSEDSVSAGLPADLRKYKAEARRLLPAGHPLLAIIEAEPDILTEAEARIRLPMLLRVLLAYRNRPLGP